MKPSLSWIPAVACSWVAFALALGLHTACTGTVEKKSQAEMKLSPEEQHKVDEYRAEIEIGRNMAGRLLAFYGTDGDDKLRGYINQVGNYVASYGDYPDRRYMFAILATDTVNAFACPGGYILLTAGALRSAQSEAELGMILGHEVAHVGKQHMFNTLKNMDKEEAEKTAKAGERVTEVPESVRMRRRPEPEEVEAVSKLAKYLGNSKMAGIGILQAAKAGMSLILEKGLDQKLEFEADQEGVKYAVRAGYEPQALKEFLARLGEKHKAAAAKKSTGDVEKTHPPVAERIQRIDTLLKDVLNADDILGATGKERFKKMVKKLPPPKNA